jgi:hypothetical protein
MGCMTTTGGAVLLKAKVVKEVGKVRRREWQGTAPGKKRQNPST